MYMYITFLAANNKVAYQSAQIHMLICKLRAFSQKDANGIANSEDTDQTAPLGLHCLLRPICPKTYDHYGTNVACNRSQEKLSSHV